MANRNNQIREPRINKEIKGHSEVRLIYKENKDNVSENDFNKIVSWEEALQISNKTGLDLIEINSKTEPIIVKLEDYSKYLYNLKKQLKQKNKNTTTIKEIQLSANISMHDLQIKVNKAKDFIENGDKVKVVLTLKGRELLRREESKKTFLQFIELMLDSGIVSFDSIPRDEDKKSIVIFKKK
jgi:translation initiation factor IF-3